MGNTQNRESTPSQAELEQANADAPRDVDRQFVTFNVAGEMFAVPMAPVQEIIRVPEVARMPLSPAALDGLANLRGRVLPIVNLRRIFHADQRAQDDSTRALVINLGQPLGFVVDRVASVVSIEPGEIEPASAIQSIVQADYLTGVINRADAEGQRQLMLVLDFDRLIQDQFSAMQSARRASAAAPDTAYEAAEADDASVTKELRLVSFTVDGQEYAIDIADVQEIVQRPELITEVPNTAAHVLGLMSLRQRLLPLVSLRRLFGMSDAEVSEHQRIVVVGLPGGAQVGLVTDTVKEVLSVPRQQAEPVPGVLGHDRELEEFESICRLEQGKRLVSIIATARLLGMQAMREALNATAGYTQTIDAEGPDMNSLSAQRDTTTGSDDDSQVVIFRLGDEEFGVPIMSVQEIVRVPDVLTKVPNTPRFVEGVINLRGTVLPVIDQRTRLGMSAIDRNDRQRIMVYTLGGQRTGFIVDSVAEVLRISPALIEPAPELGSEQGRLIRQVAKVDGDKRLVMLIDPSQLLCHRDMGAVAGMGLEGTPAESVADLPLAQAA